MGGGLGETTLNEIGRSRASCLYFGGKGRRAAEVFGDTPCAERYEIAASPF